MSLYDELQELATPQSFERGETYYEQGLVSSLVKKGDEYEAEVRGSKRYKQYIKLEDGCWLEGTCSCPYAYDGICKHLVAVGIAIDSQDFSEVHVAYEEEGEKMDSELFFSDVFEGSSPEKKIQFLKQALQKNAWLRGQYASFVAPKDAPVAKVKLDSIRENMSKALQRENFSQAAIWREMENFRDYYDDVNDILQRKLQGVFSRFNGQIQASLQQGHPEDALRILLGMYEGFILSVKEGDVADLLEQMWTVYDESLTLLYDYFHTSIMPTAQLKRMQDLWFERWDYYEQRVNHNRPESSLRYDLRPFTELLLNLASDEVSLHYLDMRVQSYQLAHEPEAAFLLLGLAKQEGDMDKWTEMAETFAAEHIEIAQLLLEWYRETGRMAAFNQLAKPLYQVYGSGIAVYLKRYLNRDEAPDLYINILTDELFSKPSLKGYQSWRSHVSESEKEAFIQRLYPPSYGSTLLVDILTLEEKWEALYQLAQEKHKDRESLTMMLKPILEHYPDFCFHLLADTVAESVQHERGRSAYRQVCEWLKLMKKIPGYASRSQIVIQECYKQPLPSLKQEMSKAGLI